MLIRGNPDGTWQKIVGTSAAVERAALTEAGVVFSFVVNVDLGEDEEVFDYSERACGECGGASEYAGVVNDDVYFRCPNCQSVFIAS